MHATKINELRLERSQVIANAIGAALLVSGIAHVIVWLADGSSLAGPVSWRKPILFGLSAGVTVLSMAWVFGKLERRRTDSWLLGCFSWAMLVEVSLITMQQWRGTASHFNRATPFDGNVLLGLESLVLVATLVIAIVVWRSWGRLRAGADMVVAIRGGLVLLLLSCVIGVLIVVVGNRQLALGGPPEQFGKGGVLKFPHGVPMHAIQTLPVMVWLLTQLGVDARSRLKAVVGALGSTSLFTVYSLLQTFTGRARFDFWWPSWIVLALSILLLIVPGWFFCLGFTSKLVKWRKSSLLGSGV